MKKIKKQHGVVLLQRTRFDFYSTQFNQVLRIEIPATIMRDLEIIKYDQLQTLLKTFIETNKVLPAELIFVLSDETLFFQDFDHVLVKDDPQLAQFLAHVPFDYIGTRTYKLEKGTRVIATNKDVYELFRKAFQSFGFEVSIIVPSFSVGAVNLANGLSPDVAGVFLKKAEALKDQNLLFTPNQDTPEKTQQEGKPVDKKRLPILIGSFVFLILILLFVIYQTFGQPTKETPVVPTPPPQQTQVVPQEPIPTQVTVDVQATPSALTVQILNRSGTGGNGVVEQLKNELITNGFKDVTVANVSGASQRNTLIVFRETVDEEIRNSFIGSLENYFNTLSTQENSNLQFDVVITTGTDINEQ